MNEVMEQNIEKLKVRYPDGYSSEASKERVDVYESVHVKINPNHPDYEVLKERGLL